MYSNSSRLPGSLRDRNVSIGADSVVVPLSLNGSLYEVVPAVKKRLVVCG